MKIEEQDAFILNCTPKIITANEGTPLPRILEHQEFSVVSLIPCSLVIEALMISEN